MAIPVFKINPEIEAIHNNGYLTVPALPGQKQTYYHWSRIHKETYNLQKIWLGQPFNSNCAILCEDIVSVVDFDNHGPEPNGMTVFRRLEKDGTFEGCIIEKTQSDGRHVYFKGIQGKRYIVQIDNVSIEVKCGRNLVYSYPSVTPNGGYTFLSERTLLNTKPSDLPELPEIFARPVKPVYEGPITDINAASNAQIDATLEHYYKNALEDAKTKKRNNTGFWLACQLRDTGLTQDQAQAWMVDYQEDVDDPNKPYTISEAETSLISAYNEPPRKPALVQNYNPYPAFVVRSMQDVINNPVKVSYLVEQWVVTGSKVLVAGPPKTVKTLLADDLALSVASGKPFLGRFKVNQTGPVIIYQGENNEAVEGDRFKRLKTVKGITEDIPVYYIGNQGLHLNDSRSVERLSEAIEAIKPIMVIIDPLYASFDGNISEQQEVTPVLNQLTAIRDKYNCAVVLVTHTNKGANGPNAPKIPDINTFGSQYLLAWYECGMFIGNSKDDSDGTDMGDELITRNTQHTTAPQGHKRSTSWTQYGVYADRDRKRGF